MNEKINYKTVLVSAAVSFLMVIIAMAFCCAFVLNREKRGDAAQEESLSGAELTEKTGGERSITLTDGTVLTYAIPKDMYDVTPDYLALVKQAYGLTAPVTSNNLIVAGSANSVYESKTAITATSFSDIQGIYSQIYGADYDSSKAEQTYSPAYVWLTTGEITGGLNNLQFEELESITSGDVTYRVAKQTYDAQTTADVSGNTTDTGLPITQYAAYSDTDDVVEIIVDLENADDKTAIDMLKAFIK